MKTVFVGLSGGVDSAVSAYLLKHAGYRVVGAFIKSWEPPFLPCTGARDRLEAMRAAAHLGIPFATYDLAEEYKRDVVDKFIAEYRSGRTPNPDVLCNRSIKFGGFWDRARADGADFIATGHYARRESEGSTWKMMRGVDAGKDQSYFLWTLTQSDLAHAMFPVGGMQKAEVRRTAEEAGLPNAARKDSQGLCFLGHVDMKDFLLRYVERKPGPVMDERGFEVGRHDGLAFHTVGERFASEGSEKLYVVAKDRDSNALIVSHNPGADTGLAALIELEAVNWVREIPDPERTYEAEVRYHGERHQARIEVGGKKASVRLTKAIRAAEGQSLVVYAPETGECIGGGIISLCRKS